MHGPAIVSREALLYGSVKSITPDVAIPVRTGDQARVSYWTQDVSFASLLTLIVLLEDGQIVTYQWRLSSSVALMPTTLTFPLGEGYILFASVEVQEPTAPCNSVFVAVDVIRGDALTGQMYTTLLRGFTGFGSPIHYPYTSLQSPCDGIGQQVVTAIANPAAGAEVVFTVPSGVEMELLSFITTLTTDGTVSNRAVRPRITDGVLTVWETRATNTQAASQVVTYAASQQIGDTGFNAPIATRALPTQLRLREGWTIGTATTNLQAGDQFSATVLTARQYPSFL